MLLELIRMLDLENSKSALHLTKMIQKDAPQNMKEVSVIGKLQQDVDVILRKQRQKCSQ